MTDAGAGVRLADYTTLRVGGEAAHFVRADTDEELIEVVAECDRTGEPLLVLGGGSNLLISDDGFPGTVLQVKTGGIKVAENDPGTARVRASAGVNWDQFVAEAVSSQWVGIEMLSGIPGLVGATPIQNVGAYGSDVSATIESVEVWNRRTNQLQTIRPEECAFGYRMSLFKRQPGHFLVLAVNFYFEVGHQGTPIAYPELATTLGVEVGGRAPAAAVRSSVLEIRARKGMVLDEQDHDTWSAGSFFTNPILNEEQAALLPAKAPQWPTEGNVKTSAAWLIQAAGFTRGSPATDQ